MKTEASRLILPSHSSQKRRQTEDEQFEMDMLAPPSINFQDFGFELDNGQHKASSENDEMEQRSYLRRFFEDSFPSKNSLVMDSFDEEDEENEENNDNNFASVFGSKSSGAQHENNAIKDKNNTKKMASFTNSPKGIFSSPGNRKNSNLISNLFGGSKNDENKLTMKVNATPLIEEKQMSSTSSESNSKILSIFNKKERKKSLNSRVKPKNIANQWFGGSLHDKSSQSSTKLQQKNLKYKMKHEIPDFLADDVEVSAILSNQNNIMDSNPIITKSQTHEQSSKAHKTRKESANQYWYNKLNLSLFISYTLTSAATSIPITLVPTIAMDIFSITSANNDEKTNTIETSTMISSIIASYAVFGTAIGKFWNGPMGDLFGARRVSCMYSLLLCASLFYLSCSRTERHVYWACAAVEYYQSAQWPCIVVILAAHYKNNENTASHRDTSQQENEYTTSNAETNTRYEGGVYITSLGSRMGSLLSTFATTVLLRYFQWHWRSISRLGSLMAFCSFLLTYKMVTDSPDKLHDPQNPIGTMPNLSGNPKQTKGYGSGIGFRLYHLIMFVYSEILLKHILPSLKHVLTSAIFWVVAISHSGGSVVLSSVRILGTYFQDTSYGTISESQAGSASIFLSVGVLMGLAVGGNIFTASRNQKAKRDLVFKLYILAIIMCYTLAFLAIPVVRRNLFHSPIIVASLQAIVTLFMGAGVAVQANCIPAIVGATFGKNKGLYAAYTDGVAYGVSSIVWKIVAGAVEEGRPEGSGWAYGWAAVALLIILASALMITFMDHYFVKTDMKGHKSLFSNEKEVVSCVSKDNTNRHDSSNSRQKEQMSLVPGNSRDTTFRRKDATPSPFDKISLPGRFFQQNSKMIHDSNDDSKDDESTILFEDISENPLPAEGSIFDNIPDFPMKGIGETDGKNGRVLALLDKEENQVCVDCSAYLPRWASIVVPRYNTNGTNKNTIMSVGTVTSPLGCFCCTECAVAHRKLGTHIVFVRSIDHDLFKEHEIVTLEGSGNNALNNIFEARLSSIEQEVKKPNHKSDMNRRLDFVRAKYENRQWFSAISLRSKSLLDEHVEHGVPPLQDDLTSVSSKRSFDSDDSNLMNAIELVPSGLYTSGIEKHEVSVIFEEKTFKKKNSFQVGMEVNYQKTKTSISEIVRIVGIHQDDPSSPYYTVRFHDGHERQTIEAKLSNIQKSPAQDSFPNSITILSPNNQKQTSAQFPINHSSETASLNSDLFHNSSIFSQDTEHVYESFIEDDTGSHSDSGLINFENMKTKDKMSKSMIKDNSIVGTYESFPPSLSDEKLDLISI